LKPAFDWTVKNLWNLFGVVGVIGTFYFSLAYVPDYVRDSNSGKVSVIHEALIDDVQELLFYEKALSIGDIESFIRGKELTQGISYPYSPDELLIQVQERFIGNKFIPLEKREALLGQIKVIRATYLPPIRPVRKPESLMIVLSWLAAGLGVFIAFLGATSIARKIKQDRETEIDIASGDENNRGPIGAAAVSIHEFEKMVGDVLEELGVLRSREEQNRDTGIDFIAEKNNARFIVVVKRFRKLLGLGTARSFLYEVSKSGANGVLVVSSGVTERTRQLIVEHNQMSEAQFVHIVVGDTTNQIKKQLTNIFD